MKKRIPVVLFAMTIAMLGLVFAIVHAQGTSTTFDGMPNSELEMGTPIQEVSSGEWRRIKYSTTIQSSIYSIYMPIISKPGVLYGRVTENGIPASDISVTLFFCTEYGIEHGPPFHNRCFNYEEITTTTNHLGKYEFANLPTLSVIDKQTYQVHWHNEDINATNRLYNWETRILDSYTQGDNVNIGDFDIGGVQLVNPLPGALVGFPATFQWIRRSEMTTDNYGPCIYGGFFQGQWYPPDMVGCTAMGNIESFTIEEPFDGIDYSYDYFWYVAIYDSSGGIGTSNPAWDINTRFRFAQQGSR